MRVKRGQVALLGAAFASVSLLATIGIVWHNGVAKLTYADEESVGGKRDGYPSKNGALSRHIQKPTFKDWPRPKVAIVITGEQVGFLEPCGCAGLGNQKGGLKRRHALIRQLSSRGWPWVAIDLGGQVKRFGPQAEIKFKYTLESLAEMGYHAVAFGPQDLRLPVEYLLQVAANSPNGKSPFVSANVGLFSFDSGYVAQQRIVEMGGKRIGITSILGMSYMQQIHNPDLAMKDVEQAIREVITEFQGQTDFRVLLSHATLEASTDLAKRFPEFEIVVTASGAAEPPSHAIDIEGTKTKLIEVGHKGMYAVVLGLYDSQRTPLRYQRVPLDARFSDSPEIQAKLVQYQKELRTLGLGGLGLDGTPHPSGRKFEGSETCGECHTQAYAKWQRTPHAHATETLVNLDPPRHHDPECLSCHVTGWEPQKYFPFKSGYRNLKDSFQLTANGCENCHGPSALHAAVERGEVDVDDSTIAKLRSQVRMRLVEGEGATDQDGSTIQGSVTQRCLECHDLDNSPDFDFETYWPEVEHHGLD